MDDLVLKATVTKNNIKNHVFDIGDYPLSKDEAKVLLKALDIYIDSLRKHGGISNETFTS